MDDDEVAIVLGHELAQGKLTVAALGDVSGLLPYDELTAHLHR